MTTAQLFTQLRTQLADAQRPGLAGALPMYTDRTGAPIPGPSGKYGWAWRLPKPAWTWEQLECIKPRTFRLL